LRRGISLVELIVSLTVLGLALTALVGLVPAGMLNLRAAEERTRAGDMAQSELEKLSLVDPATITVGEREPVIVDRVEYILEVALTNPLEATLPNTYRLRVTVRYQHGDIKRAVFRERVLTRLLR